MKIITDTAALIPPSQGEVQGLTVIPVCVSVHSKSYQDYTQITTAEFLKHIEEGGIPTTSQPAIGDILEAFESSQEEMIYLTVGDGLSGAYQTALGARNMVENPQRIHVLNSKTLAGPLHYLVKKAVLLKDQGFNIDAIKASLQECIESSVSYVIPEDFEFLKRSGRLTTVTAKIGGALKLLPVLTQSKDKSRISPIGIKRSWKAAVEMIIQRLQSLDVGENHLISVCHAGTPQKAEGILQQIKSHFVTSETEVLELSPALTTHGGPGCIVIQAIRK